jgi:hypothetical protein
MEIKRKIVIPAVGLLAVAGIGTGVAVAQSGDSGPDNQNPPAANTTEVEQGDQDGPNDQEGPGDQEEKGDKEEEEKDGS